MKFLTLRAPGALPLLLLLGACAQKPALPPPVLDDTPVAPLTEPGPQSRATAAVLAAELAGRRGDAEAAAAHTLEAARLTRDPRLADRATRLAFSAGAQELAAEAAQLWLELAPQDDDARSLALRAKVAAGEATVEDLVAWLEQAGQIEHAEEQIAAVLGAASPSADHALGLLQELEAQRPSAALAFSLGVLALRYERPELAQQALERARERGWSAVAIDEMLLRIHLAEQDPRAALVLRRLQGAIGEDRARALGIGQTLLDAQAWALAQQHFQYVARQWPEEPAADLALGLLAARGANNAAARKHFEALWESGARQDEAAWQLGRLAVIARDWPRAQTWFERVDRGNRWLDAQLGLVQVAAGQGRVEAARDELDRLRAELPEERVRLWQAEAEALRDAGRIDEALLVLDAAIDEEPVTELLYARALLHERAGDMDSAERDLATLVEQDPENATALNALGYMLADHNRDLARARDLIERALALRPEDPAVRDSLGWVLYRQGELEAARTHLQRAYSAYPDAEIGAHLGEVLWQLGERDQARAVWRQAQQADADNRTLRRTLERFLGEPAL